MVLCKRGLARGNRYVIHHRAGDTSKRATPQKNILHSNTSSLNITKMPPERPDRKKRLIEQEGRLLLALKAIKEDKYLSAAAAARSFDVPVSTLKARINGRESFTEKRPATHIFTHVEELSMEKWLLNMDARGAALTLPMLRDMANLLLSAKKSTSTIVGVNWPSRFIKRHPRLSTQLSRKYDYQRALSEDPRIIAPWFNLVQNTIEKWGIVSDDIFNFDESGFAMGIGGTQKIITSAEYHGKRALLQAGNREWVTSIECIRASGSVMPPLFIFKGKWFPEHLRPYLLLNQHGARLTMSKNGWTTDTIGIWWLKHHFIPNIGRRVGKYCLLVLDGHGSQLTPEFDQICEENHIIAICMPAHASHLLQPLDVGCFAVLKKLYGGAVSTLMRNGVNSIEKEDFLEIIADARKGAFKPSTIQNSFLATGLAPFDANKVLEKLNVQLDSLPPLEILSQQPLSSGSDSDPNTTWNLSKFQKSHSHIKEGLESSSSVLSSPIKRRIQKTYDMTLKVVHEQMFLQQRVSQLEAANKKQTKKRVNKHKFTTQVGIFGGLEGGDLDVVVEDENGSEDISLPEVPVKPIGEPTLPSMPKVRRPVTCSSCGIKGHRYVQCPTRV